jgi:hypothetical protein
VIMLTLNKAEVIERLFADYENVKNEKKQLIQDVALDCDPLAILTSQGINFEADYTREDTPRKPNEPGQDVYRASISFSIADYMFDFPYKLWVSFKATAAYVSVKSGITMNGKPIKYYDGRILNTLEALYVLLPKAPDLSAVMDVTEELVNLRSDYQRKITT